MSILASCEFFLLVDFSGIVGLVLLNPSTGRYYRIPYPPYSSGTGRYGICGTGRYGIYLDDANNDYKVVRIQNVGMNMEVMVYSLKTYKWRLIERTVEKCYAWCSVVIGHLLHIVFALKYTKSKKRIGCFDILAEKWINDVPFPHLNDLEPVNLTVIDGLLCVTAVDSMWVMKEYGVKDSWFKLMSIASDDVWDWRNITPIAFGKGSQDEVLCSLYCNSKLEYIWYNVREKKATMATLNAVLPNMTYGYICKGSLVDFFGGRNMKLYHPKQSRRNYYVVYTQ
ncbi:F-box protein At4g22390-like [Silene latifolia]|uniref:F-box protein At4g22390-like n=1 Tax=Silene latifolia TaxID=37657 RepID=UPI003D7710B6